MNRERHQRERGKACLFNIFALLPISEMKKKTALKIFFVKKQDFTEYRLNKYIPVKARFDKIYLQKKEKSGHWEPGLFSPF